MIKQVVVREDESIVVDLIRASGNPASSTTAPDPEGATLVPEMAGGVADNGYSLKVRIGRIVADEEKKLIGQVLGKTNWNRRRAADMLEISYRSLLYKIKDYNLNATK